MGSTTMPMTPTVMTTLMLPDHTNPAGNVHGGETMKLLEAAGYIAAARHMKNIPIAADTRPANAKWELRTARVESLHFIAPAFVGDVVTVEARVVFASPRSMAVGCRVMAETVSKGDAPRDTNTALLWYVCKLKGEGEDNDRDVAMVPAVVDDHDSATWSEMSSEAARLYADRKACVDSSHVDIGEDDDETLGRDTSGLDLVGAMSGERHQRVDDQSARSPRLSKSELSALILPSHCGIDGVCRGGVVLKMMDEAAGVCAWRHSHCDNTVTAAVETMDFLKPARIGNLIRVEAVVAFASSRSIDVLVQAYVTSLEEDTSSGAVTEVENLVAQASFIYIALDADGNVVSVPAVQCETPADHRRYAKGMSNYEARKRKRKK